MPKKPSTYNRILKEFTKINNKLPEERKLSIQQRRELIKTRIKPLYIDVPAYKIKVKKLRAEIYKELEFIPPKEICDLNYIDTSEYAFVEWFSLDETIRELVPDCIYVKVTAGSYGETKIFNTRNYQYGKKGVRNIVEAIRIDAENSSGKYVFSGYQKLRPRKKNDGTPENYYLDFVLYIITTKKGKIVTEEPQGDTETVKFDLPKTREVKSKKAKIRSVIERKIKLLKQKRDSKRRAKKTLQKNIEKYSSAAKKVTKSKKPTIDSKAAARKQFLATTKLLEKYYKEGKLTKYQYDKSLEKILKDFTAYNEK